jgi:hypothetical protein
VSAALVSLNDAESAKLQLTKDQEKMLKRIKAGKAKNKEMQDFIEKDIQNRKSETDTTVNDIKNYKDSEIAKLEEQLKEKDKIIENKDKEIENKDSIKEKLNNLPRLKDLNFKNLKFLSVGKKLGKMEEE